MSLHKVHIAAITEPWLTDEIDDDQISIGRYVIHRKDRMKGRGDRVCVYVSQQISVTGSAATVAKTAIMHIV